MSAVERVVHILLSAVMAGYGVHGFMADDLYLPGKRGPGVHLHGRAAAAMLAAILCAVAVLLSAVIDHYDTRNNERHYRRFARVGAIAGWTLFGVALVLDLLDRDLL